MTVVTDCIEDSARRTLERRIRGLMPDLLDQIERTARHGFTGNFVLEQAIEEAILTVCNAAVEAEQRRQWRELES